MRFSLVLAAILALALTADASADEVTGSLPAPAAASEPADPFAAFDRAVDAAQEAAKTLALGAVDTTLPALPSLVQKAATGALNPNAAPATNFDLSLWKLTLPIDADGGFTYGKAAEVKPIPPTFTASPYFTTGADGGMIFMAPTNGATTKGSAYPRSELRELDAAGGLAAWTLATGGSLNATVAVTAVPVVSGKYGRVVIAQIHGPDDELCKLYYDNGRVYFTDDKAGTTFKLTTFILKSPTGAPSAIPLGDRFDYIIKATAKSLVVYVRYKGVIYRGADTISAFWANVPLYFKAGVYVQVGLAANGANTVGTGAGQVSFYALPPPTHP